MKTLKDGKVNHKIKTFDGGKGVKLPVSGATLDTPEGTMYEILVQGPHMKTLYLYSEDQRKLLEYDSYTKDLFDADMEDILQRELHGALKAQMDRVFGRDKTIVDASPAAPNLEIYPDPHDNIDLSLVVNPVKAIEFLERLSDGQAQSGDFDDIVAELQKLAL